MDKSETVRVRDPFSEALVGNDEIADAIPLTDRSIYIVGKKVGITRLALLDKSKRLVGVVDIAVTDGRTGARSQNKDNSTPQVMLELLFIEADRKVSRALGFAPAGPVQLCWLFKHDQRSH